MLTNTEMQVPATVVVAFEIGRSLESESCFGGRKKVRSSAHQPGNVLRKYVEHLARGIASGQTFRVGRKIWKILIPAIGQSAVLDSVYSIREFRIFARVLFEVAYPAFSQFVSAFSNALAKLFSYAVGY